MNINVIDVETTGLDPEQDSVVEVAWCNELGRERFTSVIDPGQPIQAEASSIHHITDEDVVGAIKIGELVLPTPDYFVAHNSRFDQPFLPTEIPFIDTYRCALEAVPDAPKHTNQCLRYYLRLDVGNAGDYQPHRAIHDVIVTAALYRYLKSDLGLDRMIKISSRPALLPKVGFGKHFGMKWSEVPRDYLAWVLRQDFDEDVLNTANHWMKSK